ncbi:hypothetical protein roselon_00712 [Roseibacterium elongatum DSM 19469]|uniref:Glycosyl transferase family 8 n=1 Tax=Roseicyclus elongatus DSM 19469 TaxID=1294273 RepID=W8RPN4_9RHOB|nr:glycosyltransferase [Roseibacterium elongatum]AHM03139.1 hypothetical protein roselon_00712 [Roseibacterium elongatum DSM 19469]
MTSQTLSILFVADGQRLEWQSWLLASSLAMAHEGHQTVRLYAYASDSYLPEVSAATRDLYAACSVDLRALPPTPGWRGDYPHGNKLLAASDHRAGGRAIFLDTDIVCAKPLTAMADLPADTVAAAPEGLPTWGREDDRWERAYAHYGLPVPTERVRLLRGRKKEFVPYFNAGFVCFSEDPQGAEGKRFADHWLETALDFDHNCSIGGKRPWLDQITLPLTMARFGYKAEVLGETWNYSLTRRKDYSQTPDAEILHYHRAAFLEQAPQWPAILSDFWGRMPERHHDTARSCLEEMGLTL